jgi:hypothetical protein
MQIAPIRTAPLAAAGTALPARLGSLPVPPRF